MRAAVNTDPASFDGWLRVAQRMGGNLKTPQLKAAYLQALDAVENGAGSNRLTRVLDVAYQERMCYFANRIAQTELARAHIDQRAAEIMADPEISVVRWSMSQTHPKLDICDLFAKQDKFRLGSGCYPKGKAPKPPAHPFCRCMLQPVITKDAADAKESPASERQFLASMMRKEGISEAAQVMGGRAKLAAALTNPFDEVFNIHKPRPYRLGRAGDAADRIPVMRNAQAISGQRTWSDLALPDLRTMAANAEAAPALLVGANTDADAINIMRAILGIQPGGSVSIKAKHEAVVINDSSLPHVVEKRKDQRERFASLVIPTLERPTEVWAVKYDDGSTRNRYIKLFSGIKYDLLVMVKVAPDGSVFWNMMQRDRKGMNALRVGKLL